MLQPPPQVSVVQEEPVAQSMLQPPLEQVLSHSEPWMHSE
jgi:hypothetical protein